MADHLKPMKKKTKKSNSESGRKTKPRPKNTKKSK